MESLRTEKKRLSLGTLLALIFLILMVPLGVRAAEKEILIGAIEPLTGESALTGRINSRGYEMAMNEINAAGGIKSMGGAKFKFMIGDHQGKPAVGIAETERLVQSGATVIMGAWHSTVAFTATQIAEQLKTPFLVANSSADSITERGLKYVFRTITKTSTAAKGRTEFVEWMNKHSRYKAKRVAIIGNDTIFGVETAGYDKKFCEEAGFEIVTHFNYPLVARDLSVETRKLIASKPDVVMWAPYESDAIMMTRLFAEEKFAPCAIIGWSYMQNPKYIEILGKLTEYLSTITAWNADIKLPGARELAERYKKIYNEEMDATVVQVYSGVYLLRDVFERAASTDKEKVRKALMETDLKPGEKGIAWPYGVKFGPDGDNKLSATCIVQILNGKKQTIWPRELAPIEPVWPIPKWEERK